MVRFGYRKPVIIVGCGQLGASFAKKLSDLGHDVTVIDLNPESLRMLHADYSGFAATGDGVDAEVLERHGINDAYMMLALTGDDNSNIFITEMASRIYGVPHVYARLSDAQKADLLNGFGIEVLCPRRLCEMEFSKLSGIPLKEVG